MLGRRRFLVAGGTLAAWAPLLVLGCKSSAAALPASCDDTTGLSEQDRAARTTLEYVDRGGAPAKACTACQQWLAPSRDGACGGCKLLKGPIHPTGTCKAFAARA